MSIIYHFQAYTKIMRFFCFLLSIVCYLYCNLSQNTYARHHYHEDRYNFYFFHDFNQFKSLDKQYEDVKNKYYRRINRFLDTITKPTLFIRYISSEELTAQNRSVELEWIENNYGYIMSTIKNCNPQNEIWFIGDETIHSDSIKIYNVKIDEGDIVSRSPICNNKELFEILSAVNYPNKEYNLKRNVCKEPQKTSYINRIINKIKSVLRTKFVKEYHHSKTYSIENK